MSTRQKAAIEELADTFSQQLAHADTEEQVRNFVEAEAAALDPETQRYLVTLIMKRNGTGDEANSDPNGEHFVWGRVVKIHYIGDNYAIVEHIRNRPGNAEPGWAPHTSYSCYVSHGDGYRDLARSSDSFDYALLTCVAWRHESDHHGLGDAANSQAVKYFFRMVGR